MALITLTRSIGCGGTAIAQSIAKELQLEVYDDQRLQQEAMKLGIDSEELKEVDEKAPPLFDSLFSQKPKAYLDLLEATVYEVARRGEGIIFGHGSQILLRDFGCALHARVFASEPFRVQHMETQYGLSHDEARKLIRKRDRQQRGFMEFAFHMDLNDPSLYDLVINREKMSVDLASKMIVDLARSDEIKECSLSAVDAMARRALLKLVEAAVLKNHFNLSTLHLEVPEQGLVHVTAWADSKEMRDRLHTVVKDVPGVSKIQFDVGVLPLHV
jgi:cytidylate kinase